MFGLLAATAIYIGRSQVPDEAIRTAVTRSGHLLQRTWALPVARTFEHRADWQSDGSL
ncbi:hypothetical protein [Aureimonas sp. AU22]|uniref:hypothetical protein n=1 Tax=Aureimonas sp. AU22 TaxID=1638162 RepID=UPI000ADF386B|nr:hypothetical protein [Aureimonas sp. AU22]